MKKITAITITALLAVGIAGCSSDSSAKTNSRENDEAASSAALTRQQKSQPTPVYDWSQYRQTLIEITDAKANATQTTTFFFLEGIGLIGSCPSIGFPVPSTAQITNPDQKVDGGGSQGDGSISLPQVEPTGVYTGDSSGTYTVCVDDNGKPFASYWEGYVQTVSGPATYKDGRVVLTGKPTGNFTKGK